MVSFFKIFRILVTSYILYWALGLNWDLYFSLRPDLFSAPGVFSFVFLERPPILLISVLQTILVGSAIVGFYKPEYRLNTFLFFLSALFLDAIHNSYGFINAQIHVIWFYLFFIFVDFRKDCFSNILVFRFVEAFVILIYFQSGLAKLMESGISWAIDGTTLQIAWVRQNTFSGEFLASSELAAKVASVLALTFEVLSPLYFVFKKLRPWFLVVAILFHLGTWATLGIHFIHLWPFHVAALAVAYPLFQKEKFLWQIQAKRVFQ